MWTVKEFVSGYWTTISQHTTHGEAYEVADSLRNQGRKVRVDNPDGKPGLTFLL